MTDDTNTYVADEDVRQIGLRVIEAAYRLRDVDAVMPGSEARWGFDMDDVHCEVIVRIGKVPAR